MKERPNRRFKQVNPATVLLVKQFIMGFLLFCLVGLILTGIWYGTRMEYFTISAINVSGGKTIGAEVVHSKINDVLSGTYLGLVPKRFSLTYPKEAIISSLGDIERLKDVKLELVSNRTLQVTFNEYNPTALWCSSDQEAPCLFLDKTGYAFGTAPKLSGGSLVRYYTLDKDVKRTDRPMTEEDFLVVQESLKLLEDSGWFIDKVETDSARDAFYTLVEGGEIKVTLIDGAIKPFTYLQTILRSDEFKHLEPGNFQYLDLRFGKKVFVNEESLEVEVPEEEEAVLDPDEEVATSATEVN